jgi:hypothetical protein
MSTKNAERELYKLSISQANYYCRKPECGAVMSMEGYATILENAGIEVIDVHATWLEAETSQARIWTALSGLSW